MLTAQDIQGLYAILPTPAKADAWRMDAVDTVDVDETVRVVNALIADGAHGLIALGTTGECATLAQADYDRFVTCLLETVGRRVPVFVGASALGAHEAVRRARLAQDCHADGVLLGLPMWQPATDDMALDFYAGMSGLFPGLAIMVYANERAFRFAFSDEFWAALVQRAPTVTAAKYSRPQDLKRLLGIVQGRIHIVPNEMTMATFYAESPATTRACWATAASMGPWPALALMQAVLAGDAQAVQEISAALAWANATVKPIIADKALFASHNIQVEKARINAAGYCKAGPVRPPYNSLAPDLLAGAQECGRRWAALCQGRANGIRIPAAETV